MRKKMDAADAYRRGEPHAKRSRKVRGLEDIAFVVEKEPDHTWQREMQILRKLVKPWLLGFRRKQRVYFKEPVRLRSSRERRSGSPGRRTSLKPVAGGAALMLSSMAVMVALAPS